MATKEHYSAKPMAANTTLVVGTHIEGFLVAIAGTLTVTDADGTVLVNALPVALGPFIRIPLLFNTGAGGKVTLGGGAAGTLFT